MKNIALLLLSLITLSANAQWVEVANFQQTTQRWPQLDVIDRDTVAIGDKTGLFVTHNDGNTWIKLDDSLTHSIWQTSKRGLADGWRWWRREGLYYTKDEGSTWTVILNHTPADYLFKEDGSILTIGSLGNGHSREVISSSDEGVSWDTLSIPGVPSHFQLNKIAYANKDSLILLADSGTFYNYIAKTTDAGASWQVDSIPGFKYIPDMKAVNFNTIFYLSDTSLMKSTDAGKTFKEEPIVERNSSLSVLSVYNGFVALGCTTAYSSTDSARIIAHSEDLFINWEFDTIIDYSGLAGVDQLDMLSTDYGWASSFAGIYKLNESNITSVTKLKLEEEDKLRILPNPFQNKVSINWNNEYETLVIHDLRGRKVFDQRLDPKSKSTQINIEIESGIYLGSLIGKSGVESFKLIKN